MGKCLAVSGICCIFAVEYIHNLYAYETETDIPIDGYCAHDGLRGMWR